MSGLQFLGLIASDGGVQANLERLIEAQGDARKPIIKQVLEERYSKVIPLGVQNASMQDLQEAMRGYGVSGGTLQRAIRFYLDASEYSGVPISVHWTGARRSSNGVQRQTRKVTVRRSSTETTQRRKPPTATKGNVETVELTSGGKVSLTVEVNPILLSEDDRTWLFGLIDQFRGYNSNG